ncbi:MAG: hypothetical protein ACFNS8_01780, partial [Kingella oralis]
MALKMPMEIVNTGSNYLATSRRRSILNFRLPLGFAKVSDWTLSPPYRTTQRQLENTFHVFRLPYGLQDNLFTRLRHLRLKPRIIHRLRQRIRAGL